MRGGYAWWYVDALSDDGARGLTVIAFIGSVFSPYYAWARRRTAGGLAEATSHVALNVALYGADGRRWAMTERGAPGLQRSASALEIGPSRMAWDGTALTIEIEEVTAPWSRRVRGTVRVVPTALHDESFALDAAGRHRWTPIAPCARVEVDLESPRSHWQGPGYFDRNDGSAPLEADFRRWDWSRAHSADGSTAVLYDVTRRDGSTHGLALRFDPRRAGSTAFEPPPEASLPRSAWGLQRGTRSDPGASPRIVQRLEDGPFYTRSVVASQLMGQPVTAMHESLDLRRFASPVVQAMLPFRMPRRSG